MSGIHVKCGYCGQMTKRENCSFYKGLPLHDKPNCNCFQIAINKNFIVPLREKWDLRPAEF